MEGGRAIGVRLRAPLFIVPITYQESRPPLCILLNDPLGAIDMIASTARELLSVNVNFPILDGNRHFLQFRAKLR